MLLPGPHNRLKDNQPSFTMTEFREKVLYADMYRHLDMNLPLSVI